MMLKQSSILILAASMLIANSVAAQSNVTAKVHYSGVDYFGLPLGFDGKRIAMIDPAGKLLFIPAKSKDDCEVVAREFKTYSPNQIQSLLDSEFGERYQISTTKRFVVVHPWGSPGVYAKPFEEFYQRFVDFFAGHGFELEPPATPLIALVLRSRNDFDRYLINEIDARDSRINGYYSRISNRIMTYDPRAQIRKDGDRWIYDAGPILHEATHQFAFNTGVHNRYSPPPKWLSEGVATLFEAKGFNHATKYKARSHRINATRLQQLRTHLKKGSINAALINLIANDKLFKSDAELAYALSWGLSFFLYETRQDDYFQFIKQDSQRKNFHGYPADQRLRDFILAFGNDFEAIEKQLRDHFLPQNGSRTPSTIPR